MKEIRKCKICKIGEFTVKTTSKRKTCCTVCSAEYAANFRKDWHENPTPERREHLKRYKNAYYQKTRDRKNLELGRIEK